MDYAKMVSTEHVLVCHRRIRRLIISANRDLPATGVELPGGLVPGAVGGVGLPGGRGLPGVKPGQPSAFHQAPPIGHLGIHTLSSIFHRLPKS